MLYNGLKSITDQIVPNKTPKRVSNSHVLVYISIR